VSVSEPETDRGLRRGVPEAAPPAAPGAQQPAGTTASVPARRSRVERLARHAPPATPPAPRRSGAAKEQDQAVDPRLHRQRPGAATPPRLYMGKASSCLKRSIQVPRLRDKGQRPRHQSRIRKGSAKADAQRQERPALAVAALCVRGEAQRPSLRPRMVQGAPTATASTPVKKAPVAAALVRQIFSGGDAADFKYAGKVEPHGKDQKCEAPPRRWATASESPNPPLRPPARNSSRASPRMRKADDRACRVGKRPPSPPPGVRFRHGAPAPAPSSPGSAAHRA